VGGQDGHQQGAESVGRVGALEDMTAKRGCLGDLFGRGCRAQEVRD
jgi:hypothetical protein